MQELWATRNPRERMVITAVAALLALALLTTLIVSAHRASPALRESVLRLQRQSNRMAVDAAALQRLRATPIKMESGDLRATVQTQAQAAGVAGSLAHVDAEGANRVKTVCNQVSFSDWLAWVANLQALKIHLDASRIEALATPGLVNATATFARGAAQ